MHTRTCAHTPHTHARLTHTPRAHTVREAQLPPRMADWHERMARDAHAQCVNAVARATWFPPPTTDTMWQHLRRAPVKTSIDESWCAWDQGASCLSVPLSRYGDLVTSLLAFFPVPVHSPHFVLGNSVQLRPAAHGGIRIMQSSPTTVHVDLRLQPLPLHLASTCRIALAVHVNEADAEPLRGRRVVDAHVTQCVVLLPFEEMLAVRSTYVCAWGDYILYSEAMQQHRLLRHRHNCIQL